MPPRRPEVRCDELRLVAGVVFCGGGCKGGHFVCFAEIFGNFLTAAGFSPDSDDAGWLAERRDDAGWLAEPALLED